VRYELRFTNFYHLKSFFILWCMLPSLLE
jgi:hypothetical protein